MKNKTSKQKKKKDFEKEMHQSLRGLYQNDELLNNKVMQVYKLQQDIIQQQQPIIKEIAIGPEGISVKGSSNPIKDINDLLKDRKIKRFVGLIKTNSIIKQCSYID